MWTLLAIVCLMISFPVFRNWVLFMVGVTLVVFISFAMGVNPLISFLIIIIGIIGIWVLLEEHEKEKRKESRQRHIEKIKKMLEEKNEKHIEVGECKEEEKE